MGNFCQCPTPPGGEVNCGPHQLAICRVKDGKVHSQCIDQPGAFADLNATELEIARRNWALQIITGTKRVWKQKLVDEDKQILMEREYHNEKTGEVVTFSLPWKLEIEGSVASVAY
jgi:hypothetical protein